jgi:uncharacterized protein
MTKAVLDSSVLVSAFLKPGSLPATLLLRAREGAFSLVLSSYVIQETAAVLVRPKHQASRSFTPDEVARYCRDLLAVAELVGDLPNIEAVPDDPKDDPIVATAVAGKADYLVTGDRAHLLPIKEHAGVRIVGVREFLDLL